MSDTILVGIAVVNRRPKLSGLRLTLKVIGAQWTNRLAVDKPDKLV
jgi:hypothetical protein